MHTRQLVVSLIVSSLVLALAPSRTNAQGDIMWATHGMSTGYYHSDLGFFPMVVSDDGAHTVVALLMVVQTWATGTTRLLHATGQVHRMTVAGGQSISPDGRYIVMVRENPAHVLLIDGATHEIIDSISSLGQGHSSVIRFSEDSQQMLAITGGEVALFSVPGMHRIWNVKSAGASAPSFSRDGSMIAWCEAGQLCIFRASTGGLVRRLAGTHAILQSGFSEDDSTVVGYTGREIVFWNSWDSSPPAVAFDRELLEGHMMAVDRTGRYAITISSAQEGDSTVRIWDTRTRSRVRDYGLRSLVYPLKGLTTSSDGHTLTVMQGSGQVTPFGMLDGAIGRTYPEGLGSAGARMALSSDGSRLLVMAGDRTMRSYDAASGALLSLIVPDARAMGLYPGGAGWIEGRYSEMLELRALSPDGGTVVLELPDLPGDEQSIGLTTSADRIAATRNDSTWRLYDGVDGHLIREYPRGTGQVLGVSFSPDGRYVAARTYNGPIDIWDVESGSIVRTVTPSNGAFAFSSDSKFVAFDRDRTVRTVPIIGTGERTDGPFPDMISSITMSSDGRWMTVGGSDPFLVDLSTGPNIRRYYDPLNYFEYGGCSAIFSPDGGSIIACSYDGDIIRWRIPPPGSSGVSTNHDGSARLSIGQAGRTLRLMIRTETSASMRADLYDALGARVAAVDEHRIAGGAHAESLNVQFLASGAYLLRVSVDGVVTTQAITLTW